uniref:Uncharacterized protein n=1 Tax=Anguilla anguilla TaxID=7936 RepID=A0A0E9UQQ8_ANGAN
MRGMDYLWLRYLRLVMEELMKMMFISL